MFLFEIIGILANLAAVLGILVGVRSPRIIWYVRQGGQVVVSGCLVYGLGDARAYAKVLAASLFVQTTGKPAMPNTAKETVESGFSFAAWRKTYVITFELPS